MNTLFIVIWSVCSWVVGPNSREDAFHQAVQKSAGGYYEKKNRFEIFDDEIKANLRAKELETDSKVTIFADGCLCERPEVYKLVKP